MKSFVIFGCMLALALAQRPSFAGSSAKVYPELASRFQDTSNSEASPISTGLESRIGDTKTPPTTQKLPVEAEVVNRFNQHPKNTDRYGYRSGGIGK